jgi:hypothetical protein
MLICSFYLKEIRSYAPNILIQLQGRAGMKLVYAAVLQSVLEFIFGFVGIFSCIPRNRIDFEPSLIGSNILSPEAHIAKLVRALHSFNEIEKGWNFSSVLYRLPHLDFLS